MVDIKTWKRGETIRIGNTYTDIDDAVYDPDTVELEIYNPSEILDTTVTYAGSDIKRTSKGIYYYDYDIASDATAGWWLSKWTGASGGFSDVSRNQFKVADPEEKLYCTPEEVWVRAGQDETFVSRYNVTDYIRQSMAEIDEIYQKSFNYSNDKTEWFDTSQPDMNTELRSLFLTYTPVRSITSVKEYDTSDTEVQSYDSDDYWVDLGTGKIQMKTKEFEHQKHRVEVVYKYGYDTIPQKIVNLCIILSAMKVLLNFIGESVDQVTSYTACSISVSVGEPYTAAAKGLEILVKERDKLLSEIGRLRPSIFIV
jgi:hypothetical protein